MVDELRLRRRVRLILRKKIPWGAGLGGGSSDAAAAMRAVAQLSGKPIQPERLLKLGATLGADVPFFLLGGAALGLGRGTEVYALPDFLRRTVVLAFPGVSINTAAAYAEFDRQDASLTEASETDKIFSFCASVWGAQGSRLRNDFETVVFSAYPQVARLKRLLTRAGASPALLSGSGSAVYGLFDSRTRADRAVQSLKARHPEWSVWVSRTLSRSESEKQWKPIA
jgi:4-diphosphocytidyl-2-C-methyl-D-erythritol kinase